MATKKSPVKRQAPAGFAVRQYSVRDTIGEPWAERCRQRGIELKHCTQALYFFDEYLPALATKMFYNASEDPAYREYVRPFLQYLRDVMQTAFDEAPARLGRKS